MAVTDSAGDDLTNDYATCLGTKLDNGFATAGGHTNARAAYFRAPLGENRLQYISLPFLP